MPNPSRFRSGGDPLSYYPTNCFVGHENEGVGFDTPFLGFELEGYYPTTSHDNALYDVEHCGCYGSDASLSTYPDSYYDEDDNRHEFIGAELRSVPATLSWHLNNRVWRGLFAHCVEPHGRTFSDNTTGMHVHVHRGAWGQLTLGKAVHLLNRKDMIEYMDQVCGRAPGATQYAQRAPAKPTKVLRWDRSRYQVLNLQPSHTVEFRCFQTPRSYGEFCARLEFPVAVRHFCRETTIPDVTRRNLSRFVAEHAHTYPHLFRAQEGETTRNMFARSVDTWRAEAVEKREARRTGKATRRTLELSLQAKDAKKAGKSLSEFLADQGSRPSAPPLVVDPPRRRRRASTWIETE